MRLMRSLAASLALLAGAALPASAQTPTPLATSTLATLCAASGTEGDAAISVGYCRGFLVGVWQYEVAITGRGGRQPIFCLPQPAPSLGEAQVAFVAWVAANPQFANDRAVDGLLRWAASAYPCAAPSGARRR